MSLTPRLPSPALVVAVLALLVALGGTTYAVTALPKNSVGAAQVKKNAVRSPEVKNNSLRLKDFRKDELGADVFVKYVGDDSVPVTGVVGVGDDTVVKTLSLPAGTYYVTASIYGFNQSAAIAGELRCFLRSTGEVLVTGTGGLYVKLPPNVGNNNERGFLSLDLGVTLKASDTVTVACNKGTAGQVVQAGASLSAIRAHSVTSVP